MRPGGPAGTTVADMMWVLACAVLVVVLVGAAVLPRRAGQPREGFPWFWVAFPAAALLVAASIAMGLAWAGVSKWGTVVVHQASYEPSVQFLSNEQFNQMYVRWQVLAVARLVLPIVAVATVGLSVWAWRRGRV